MCRFVAYIGKQILLGDLVARPKHSLIDQSFNAVERSSSLNGDGFGLGWYTPSVAVDPCVFTSINPAWSNRNLLNLVNHIKSGCFFSHIRAASAGMPVSESNCHPFSFGKYLWMHNGTIEGFDRFKRRLINSLSDEIYESIQGSTDSEHAFGVFLNLLGDCEKYLSVDELSQKLVDTIRQLEEWVREVGAQKPSMYNFAVTDGKSILAVRYVSDSSLEPISLYFSRIGERKDGVVIASEKLTDMKEDWTRVAPNHVLMVGKDLNERVSLLPNI